MRTPGSSTWDTRWRAVRSVTRCAASSSGSPANARCATLRCTTGTTRRATRTPGQAVRCPAQPWRAGRNPPESIRTRCVTGPRSAGWCTAPAAHAQPERRDTTAAYGTSYRVRRAVRHGRTPLQSADAGIRGGVGRAAGRRGVRQARGTQRAAPFGAVAGQGAGQETVGAVQREADPETAARETGPCAPRDRRVRRVRTLTGTGSRTRGCRRSTRTPTGPRYGR